MNSKRLARRCWPLTQKSQRRRNGVRWTDGFGGWWIGERRSDGHGMGRQATAAGRDATGCVHLDSGQRRALVRLLGSDVNSSTEARRTTRRTLPCCGGVLLAEPFAEDETPNAEVRGRLLAERPLDRRVMRTRQQRRKGTEIGR